MQSKIESTIDAIEDYLANCKFQTLSTTRIIVNKEEIDELIRELRQVTPEEIKRYRQIISNRDAILNDAKAKADALMQKTTAEMSELVNEHEVMQQAYAKASEVVNYATAQAQEILDAATIEANQVRAAAMQYTDDRLAELEAIITKTAQLANSNYEELIANLNSCNAVVKTNRNELHPAEDDDFESLGIEEETADNNGGSGLDLI